MIFYIGDLQSIGLRVAQKKNFENFFFGNFQKISKLSKNIFWTSYDHVVAQKSIFWTKILKKVAKTLTSPPPWLVSGVIYMGFYGVLMGLGCPKFFLGEFGTFLKNKKVSNFFTMTLAFFANFFKFFALKWAQNDQMWHKSVVWKTSKTSNKVCRRFKLILSLKISTPLQKMAKE